MQSLTGALDGGDGSSLAQQRRQRIWREQLALVGFQVEGDRAARVMEVPACLETLIVAGLFTDAVRPDSILEKKSWLTTTYKPYFMASKALLLFNIPNIPA